MESPPRLPLTRPCPQDDGEAKPEVVTIKMKADSWVEDIFARADKDKSGTLSKTELKNLLHQDDELRESFRDMGGREWKDFWKVGYGRRRSFVHCTNSPHLLQSLGA